jgi:hypothetical protein
MEWKILLRSFLMLGLKQQKYKKIV